MRAAVQWIGRCSSHLLFLGLALCSLPGGQSLAAAQWLKAGRAGPLVTGAADQPSTAGHWKLGLLPFPISDCLLPGETKQVHLYEARFIQLFADAASSHHDCLGAMYFTPSGNVAAVSTLLEVEEFKKEEFGVWAQLKCVGRVKLLEVSETDYQYVSATVEPFFDSESEAPPEPMITPMVKTASSPPPSAEEAEAMAATAKAAAEAAVAAGVSEAEVLKAAAAMLAGAEDQVREVHDVVLELQRRKDGLGRGAAPAGEEGEEGEAKYSEQPGEGRLYDGAPKNEAGRVEWGHEVRSGEAEMDTSLDELISARRELLLSQGMDLPPCAGLLEALEDVWCVSSEAQAERQLVSFAAAAVLSPNERAQTLGMDDTSERLTHVLCALRTQQRRLAAELALSEALPGM